MDAVTRGVLYAPLVGNHTVTVAERPVVLPAGLGVGIPHQDRAINGEHAAVLGARWFYDWGWAGYEQERDPFALRWPALWELHRWVPPVAAAGVVDPYVTDAFADDRLPLIYNEPEGQAFTVQHVVDAMSQLRMPFCGFGTIASAAGMAWLDRYLDAGGPLPAAWHFHIYPYAQFCPPGMAYVTDCWKWLLAMFQEWNQRRGGNLPLIVSETNANTAGIDDQIAVLNECYHAVQRGDLVACNWFCVRWVGYQAYASDWKPDVMNAWLIDGNGMITRIGKEFRRLAA